MVHQHIAFAQHLEEILILIKLRRIERFNRRIMQVAEALQAAGEAAQETKIQRPVNLKDKILKLEFSLQLLQGIRVDSFLDLQTGRDAPPAFAQLFFNLLKQVLRTFLINRQVGVAG
ncbi:hypothetical protein D3C73_1003350 [compost metagenome]